MSVLALTDYRGVSESAERMRRMSREACDFAPTISLGARYADAHDALERACEQAAEAGWDGYGGAAVDLGAAQQAYAFLRALPTSFPLPEIGVDPDGEILLEWDLAPRQVFSMSIDANGVVSYAGLYGKNKVHGKEHFLDVVPKAVVDALARLFPEK